MPALPYQDAILEHLLDAMKGNTVHRVVLIADIEHVAMTLDISLEIRGLEGAAR